MAAAVLHGSRGCWATDCVRGFGEGEAGQAEEGREGGELHCGREVACLLADWGVLFVSLLYFLPLPGLVGWRSTVPGSPVVDGACLLGGWLSCSTLL